MSLSRVPKAFLLAVLIIGAAASGCREAPPVLKVGCQGDRAFTVAVQIAIEKIEQSGSPVRVEVVFDSMKDWAPSLVVGSADSFLRDPEILAVIGFSSSDASLAAARMFNRHGIPQIIPTGTSPKLVETGPWTFRLCPNDARQAGYLARTAWSRMGARRCAVVYQNSDYGRGLVNLFRSEFENLGGEITLAALLGSGFSKPAESELYVRQIIKQEPDLLVMICQPQQAERIREELNRQQSALPQLASDSMGTRIMLTQMIDRFDGMYLSLFYHPEFSFPDNAAFVKRYQEIDNLLPGYEAALAYDSLMLLHQAVLEGARTRGEIRKFLEELTGDRPPFSGVAGPILFSSGREVDRPLHLGLIRGGELLLAPPDESLARGDSR